MSADLLAELANRGERIAERMTVARPLAARRSIERLRRRRKAHAAMMLVSALGIAIWLVVEAARAGPLEPARDGPLLDIVMDQPLEPQLLEAIERGDHDAIRKLIELGAFPVQLEDGRSFVGTAAARCDIEALRLLDDVGALRTSPAEVRLDYGLQPAIQNCGPAVVEQVLTTSPVELVPVDVMDLAARVGSPEVVRWLARAGYPTEVEGDWSALLAAAEAGQVATVAVLLEEGADPTVDVRGLPVAEWVDRSHPRATIATMISEAAGGAP